MSSTKQRRAELQAHFVLYGFHPMSRIRNNAPLKAALLVDDAGKALRVAKQVVIASGFRDMKKRANNLILLTRRQQREWSDLTTADLERMYEKHLGMIAPARRAEVAHAD